VSIGKERFAIKECSSFGEFDEAAAARVSDHDFKQEKLSRI